MGRGEIKIPFHEDMKEAILCGRKTCTARFQRYGDVGDWFYLDNEKYVITLIANVELGHVANNLYRSEGFATPNEFLAKWKQIHPERYSPQFRVFVHWFERRDR